MADNPTAGRLRGEVTTVASCEVVAVSRRGFLGDVVTIRTVGPDGKPRDYELRTGDTFELHALHAIDFELPTLQTKTQENTTQ